MNSGSREFDFGACHSMNFNMSIDSCNYCHDKDKIIPLTSKTLMLPSFFSLVLFTGSLATTDLFRITTFAFLETVKKKNGILHCITLKTGF